MGDPAPLTAVLLENGFSRRLPVLQRLQMELDICQLLLGIVAGQCFLNGLL
ncbi:hypothetical protein D3C78_1616530 [compost metagenome]